MFDLSSLTKAVALLGDQRTAIRSEIEALQVERERVACAPPTKAEIKAAYAEWIRSCGAYYEKHLHTKLEPLIRKPGMLLEPARAQKFMSIFSAAVRPEDEITVGALDAALCFVFPDAVAQASAVDRMQFVEGMALDKRAKRLKELDDQIEQLLAQETELLEVARAAGVNMERT